MGQDAMLGEYMKLEQFCKLRTVDHIVSRDEYGLFRKPVYNDQDGCEARGGRELLYEIH